jgi:hypothetical protein
LEVGKVRGERRNGEIERINPSKNSLISVVRDKEGGRRTTIDKHTKWRVETV